MVFDAAFNTNNLKHSLGQKTCFSTKTMENAFFTRNG